MRMKTTLEQLKQFETQLLEEQTLGVNITISAAQTQIDVELQTDTSYGQDFIVSLVLPDEEYTLESFTYKLLDELYEWLDNYDEDYEASLWIGPDGHGKNGAPYHISAILRDMLDGWGQMDELYKQLYKFVQTL